MITILQLLGVVAEDDSEPEETSKEDGVLWTTRTTCRTCGDWIEDVQDAPTATDTTEPLQRLTGGEARATFCSDRCRRDFVDARDGWTVVVDA